MTRNTTDRRSILLSHGNVEIELYSLAQHGSGVGVSALAYLQYSRSGIARLCSPTGNPEDSPQAIRYRAGLGQFCNDLAKRIVQGLNGVQPDAIIELPSTREFNTPYTAALRKCFPGTADLSGALSRLNQVKSGETELFDDVLADTIANRNYDLSNVRILIVVDDVLAKGKTVGAAIVRLRELGLPVDARILVAAPLVIVGT